MQDDNLSTTEPKNKTISNAGFSPYSGCTIIITVAVVILGMILWGIYSLVSQDRQIASFTQSQPQPVPVATATPDQAAALKIKFDVFYKALEAQEEQKKLTLSLEELNQWIGVEDSLKEWRGIVHFTNTEPAEKLVWADVSLKLNGIPFTGSYHYLIGRVAMKVSYEADATGATSRMQVRVNQVLVPGKTVSEGFVQGISQHHWLYTYFEDKKLGPLFYRIRGVEVTTDGIILTSGKSYTGK